MSSESDITNYYVSGWCGTCGRKRGADGRCSNCDAWWTSPLVQVGGPAVAVTFLLLFGIISLVKSKSAPPELVMQPAPRLVASNSGGISPASPYLPPSRAVSYPSAPMASVAFRPQTASAAFTPLPTAAALREAQRIAEFTRLQEMTRAAESAIRADDMAREARSRAFSRSRPLTTAPAYGAYYSPMPVAPQPSVAPRTMDTAPAPANNAESSAELL